MEVHNSTAYNHHPAFSKNMASPLDAKPAWSRPEVDGAAREPQGALSDKAMAKFTKDSLPGLREYQDWDKFFDSSEVRAYVNAQDDPFGKNVNKNILSPLLEDAGNFGLKAKGSLLSLDGLNDAGNEIRDAYMQSLEGGRLAKPSRPGKESAIVGGIAHAYEKYGPDASRAQIDEWIGVLERIRDASSSRSLIGKIDKLISAMVQREPLHEAFDEPRRAGRPGRELRQEPSDDEVLKEAERLFKAMGGAGPQMPSPAAASPFKLPGAGGAQPGDLQQVLQQMTKAAKGSEPAVPSGLPGLRMPMPAQMRGPQPSPGEGQLPASLAAFLNSSADSPPLSPRPPLMPSQSPAASDPFGALMQQQQLQRPQQSPQQPPRQPPRQQPQQQSPAARTPQMHGPQPQGFAGFAGWPPVPAAGIPFDGRSAWPSPAMPQPPFRQMPQAVAGANQLPSAKTSGPLPGPATGPSAAAPQNEMNKPVTRQELLNFFVAQQARAQQQATAASNAAPKPNALVDAKPLTGPAVAGAVPTALQHPASVPIILQPPQLPQRPFTPPAAVPVTADAAVQTMPLADAVPLAVPPQLAPALPMPMPMQVLSEPVLPAMQAPVTPQPQLQPMPMPMPQQAPPVTQPIPPMGVESGQLPAMPAMPLAQEAPASPAVPVAPPVLP